MAWFWSNNQSNYMTTQQYYSPNTSRKPQCNQILNWSQTCPKRSLLKWVKGAATINIATTTTSNTYNLTSQLTYIKFQWLTNYPKVSCSIKSRPILKDPLETRHLLDSSSNAKKKKTPNFLQGQKLERLHEKYSKTESILRIKWIKRKNKWKRQHYHIGLRRKREECTDDQIKWQMKLIKTHHQLYWPGGHVICFNGINRTFPT